MAAAPQAAAPLIRAIDASLAKDVELLSSVEFLRAVTACGADPALHLTQKALTGWTEAWKSPEPLSVSEVSRCRRLASSARQFAWDRLHCGEWRAVAAAWRKLYAVSSRIVALCQVEAARVTQQCAAACAGEPGTDTADPTSTVPAHTTADAGGKTVARAECATAARCSASVAVRGATRKRPRPSSAAGAAENRHVARKASLLGSPRRPVGEAPSSLRAAVEKALYTLDMALMLGGPQDAGPTHALIAAIEGLTKDRAPQLARPVSPDSSCSRDTTTERTSTVPLRPLPPGSADLRSCVPRQAEMPLLVFLQSHMKPRHPVIITGAMDVWPAMGSCGPGRAWSNVDYLKSVAGRRTVPVELGSHYMDDKWSQQLMTLSTFIDTHVVNSSSATIAGAVGAAPAFGYLAQHPLFDQVPALRNDIIVPDYCILSTGPCSPPAKAADDGKEHGEESKLDHTVAINAWLGPAGTVSCLHHDPKHNLLCQVVGSKFIRLYHPTQSAALYPHEGLMNNTSQVDIDTPDHSKFPKFATAPYWECELRAGEMLYIPPRFWHYVRSLSTSFSVSFWWE